MKTNYFLLFAAVGIITACNNSGKDKEEKKDTGTVATNHSGMDHPMPSGAVPELPAVPEGAKTYFIGLKQGATVKSPVKIEMGVMGLKVDTAGPVVASSGHHHLMIDGPDSLAAGTVVPKDSVNIHFGKGQTETEINLTPGKHKLTLQFADGAHRSYGSKMASTITVTVKQ